VFDRYLEHRAKNCRVVKLARDVILPPNPSSHPHSLTCEGWRMQVTTFFLRTAPRAWHTPMVVVDLPNMVFWRGGVSVVFVLSVAAHM
jgi:hypothetical protein